MVRRLGVYAPGEDVSEELEVGITTNEHNLGRRKYEYSDHLGNVRVVFYDRKQMSMGTIAAAYEYYPFGMSLQSMGAYRYGFNGKEEDDESGWQDYGMRMYNPVLARFFSVDPMYLEYPELSTYQFASNTPVQAIDMDGMEARRPQNLVANPDAITVDVDRINPAMNLAMFIQGPSGRMYQVVSYQEVNTNRNWYIGSNGAIFRTSMPKGSHRLSPGNIPAGLNPSVEGVTNPNPVAPPGQIWPSNPQSRMSIASGRGSVQVGQNNPLIVNARHRLVLNPVPNNINANFVPNNAAYQGGVPPAQLQNLSNILAASDPNVTATLTLNTTLLANQNNVAVWGTPQNLMNARQTLVTNTIQGANANVLNTQIQTRSNFNQANINMNCNVNIPAAEIAPPPTGGFGLVTDQNNNPTNF